MGTSTRNKGQSGHTPLVPSWLEEDDENEKNDSNTYPKIPPEGDVHRFTGPRKSFTEYVNHGGRNVSSMKAAVSHYVRRSLGGSTNATKRLGSARRSTGRLFDVLNTLGFAGSIDRIANELSIENLEGLSADEFFVRIADFIVPDGGPNDEGIARSAYFDAIIDNPELRETPIEQLNQAGREAVLQNFMRKVIVEHIMNDIANQVIQLPNDMNEISHIERQVEQLVKNNISDAFTDFHKKGSPIRSGNAQKITDRIYVRVYDILGDEE